MRRRSYLCAGLGIMLLGVARPLAAQRDLDSLSGEAARLTSRFADRRVAAAEGYRRIGADFPGMGEHWLQPEVLLSGQIDARLPTLLMYADVGGRPTLLGVGFVRVVQGDSADAGVPGWPGAWHEHSGLLSDESGVAPGKGAPGATHLWILHAWTELENRGGRYSADNWGLPFHRAGIAVPVGVDADVGRALSLADGGDAYLVGLLTDGGFRTAVNRDRADSLIAGSRARVDAWLSRARSSAAPADIAALREEWRVLTGALRSVFGDDVDVLLRAPHQSGHDHAVPQMM